MYRRTALRNKKYFLRLVARCCFLPYNAMPVGAMAILNSGAQKQVFNNGEGLVQ